MDCLFCKIGAGEIPGAIVHEDAHTMAFLDIAPLAEGHALVIPKAHAAYASEVESWDALMDAVRVVRARLSAALGEQDALIAIHDGPAAGQEVPHVHVHIVPRPDDAPRMAVHSLFKDRPQMDGEALQALAATVRGA